jgi:carbamoyl-phosphate synthase large subunit
LTLSVLVAGCGGQSVGAGIISALRLQGGYRIVAADMRPECPALLTADAAYRLPAARHPSYLGAILDLCDREEIRAILPGSHFDSIELSRLAPELALFGVEVLANPWPTVEAAVDKLRCCELLQRAGIPVPDFEPAERAGALLQRSGLPVVLKPRQGQGSRDVHVVHTAEELDLLLRLYDLRREPMLVQQHVGSDAQEYTTGLALARSGRLLGSVTLRRTIRSGYTESAVSVAGGPLRDAALAAARALGARGPFNAQMRLHAGVPYIFEINPRFSGTTPMRARLGVNEPHILLQERLFDIEEACPEPPEGVLVLRDLRENYFHVDELKTIVDLRPAAP